MKIRSKHMSMLIAFLLAFAMVLTIPLSAMAATGVIGDIDNDGAVSQSDLDYLNGVMDGTQQANAACDVNGDNMIDSDDVVVLKHLINPENPALEDPDDLLNGAQSDNLQALIARGDSTQALKIDAGSTAAVTFAEVLDWSEKTVLGMDVLLVGCESLQLQVAVTTGADTQTAEVTANAEQANWSTVYVELPADCSEVTGLQITVPAADDVTVYLDSIQAYASILDDEYPETDSLLTSGGTSDYVVVYPAGGSINAAQRLVNHLATATGVTLNIVTDADYTSGKALFVGNTAQTQAAGIVVDAARLGQSGHIVKTIGENCYMVGAADSGNQFAVTTFLKHTVGYAVYDKNEVILEHASEVYLRSFDGEPNLPAIAERPLGSKANAGSAEYAYANMVLDNGWLTPNGSANAWHNTLDYLPAKQFATAGVNGSHWAWYNDLHTELCFTAHGYEDQLEAMAEEVAKVVIKAAEEKPNVNRMTFTMQDSSDKWCTCDACKASEGKYGAKTASCIILLNKVMDKVNAYMDENMDGRRITLYFFAYLVAQDAPVVWDDAAGKWVASHEDVVPHEGVGVMCAPLHADYAYPMDDEKNEEYYTNLQQWKDLGLPVAYWVYNMNFTSHFVPTNTFATDVANYPLYEDAGVVWLYNLGQWQNRALTGFNHLKEFLQTQLAWDTDCDTESLTDDYFAAQFKAAAPAMRQFYDAMRARLDYCVEELGVTGDIADAGMYTTDAFPEEIINEYLGYIDAAIAAIESLETTDADTYTLVYNRILAESLFPRFYQITLYGDSYDEDALVTMMQSFRADCNTIGLGYCKENVKVDQLWNEWGIGEVDLTSTGMHDIDLSTGDTISLTAEGLSGTITGIAVDGGEIIPVADGNMTLTDGTLTVTKALWESFGLGEHTLYVHTTRNYAKLNITIATKVIDSYSDLEAMNNGLTGYYVMSADIDAAADAYLEISGFAGTLDGRGHAISNLRVWQGGLFNAMGAATVKNLGLLDVVNSHATNGAALAWTASGAKLENLVITSDNCIKVVEELQNGATATNCVAILTNGNYFVNSGAPWAAASTYTNIYTVMGKASGDQPGLSNSKNNSTWTDCATYADTDALIEAGTVAPCTIVEDEIRYGSHVIAETTKEEIDLTPTGMHDIDLSTGDTVSLTVTGASGNIKGVSVDGGDRISVADGNMTLTDGVLTVSKAVWESLGLGEHTLYVHTTTANYKLDVTIITRVITELADFQAIQSTNGVLTGYYVLGSDVDMNGTLFSLINGGTLTAYESGFRGTLDGRGYAVKNAKVYDTGFIKWIGMGGVVKNIAFLDVQTTYTNASAIGSFVAGAKIENVVVTSASCTKVIGEIGSGTQITNMLVIMPKGTSVIGNAGIYWGTGANCPVTNVNAVMGAASGNGLYENLYVSTWTDCANHSSIDALIAAGTVAPCTIVEDEIRYGEHVIAETTKEEIDLTPTGMHDIDLSTGDTVSLTEAGISGNIKGVSVDGGERISVADGNMTLTDGVLTVSKAVWESLGLGEHTLYVHTTTAHYKLDVTIATLVIDTYSDLAAVKNNLAGYYVMSASIDAASQTLEISGFAGTLDGRGHGISNLKVYQGGLFNAMGAATVKNLALLKVVNYTTNGAALAWGVSGAKLENLVITSDNCIKVVEELQNGATATNCVAILTKGNYFVNSGSPWAAASTYTNIYTVMGNASGEKNGLCNNAYSSKWNNCATYATVEDLIASGNVAPCTAIAGSLYYEKNLVAMTDYDMVITEDAVIDAAGMIGTPILTSVDKAAAITVANGNVTLVDGTLTITSEVLQQFGAGKHILYLKNDQGFVYRFNVTIITKVIGSYSDLQAMNNDKKGYYVMSADVDAASNYVEIKNFAGTLDGRGYAIKNLKVYQGGLFHDVSGTTVKNLGLLNVVNAHTTEGAVLSWAASGVTFENLVVTSSNCIMIAREFNTGSTVKNCVAIMANGQYFTNVGGANATATVKYSNIYTVMGKASGDQPGLSNGKYNSTWTNCANYANTDALIASGNVAPCSSIAGALYYGRTRLATSNYNMVISQDAVIDAAGMLGTPIKVSVDSAPGIDVADGNVTLVNDKLTITTKVLKEFGAGPHVLYLKTDQGIVYSFIVTILNQ